MASDSSILDELYGVIASRKGTDPDKSYTAKLFARGRGKIAQKLGEEAVETVVAALSETPEHVVSESADLLYHLAVVWAECGITPQDAFNEIDRRERIYGIAERQFRGYYHKATRMKGVAESATRI